MRIKNPRKENDDNGGRGGNESKKCQRWTVIIGVPI